MTLWEEVDQPVLRWILSLPPPLDSDDTVLHLPTEDPQPVTEPGLENLNSQQVDASLRRLLKAEFIEANPDGWSAGTTWLDLRITAKGLKLYDEWPNFDQAASAVGMHMALSELAKAAQNPQQESALRRASAIVAGLGDAVIKSTAQGLAADIGGDVGSP